MKCKRLQLVEIYSACVKYQNILYFTVFFPGQIEFICTVSGLDCWIQYCMTERQILSD